MTASALERKPFRFPFSPLFLIWLGILSGFAFDRHLLSHNRVYQGIVHYQHERLCSMGIMDHN